MDDKCCHLTNHCGTIRNLNNVFEYLNRSKNLQTMNCKFPYNITHKNAGEYWDNNKTYFIKNYDTIIITDTATYARPFLQNIEEHNLRIIVYITNRFDWGTTDAEYYKLYSKMSNHSRVFFLADNYYDMYYAKLHNINLHLDKTIIRLCPLLSAIETDNVERKMFVYNRGTLITKYMHLLEFDYEIYGQDHKKYKDEREISQYIGYLHLPYQTNIQSLYENLGHSIIYFIPSKSFLMDELIDTDWYYFEEKNRDKEMLKKSIELSEWYSKDNECLFEYFSSWVHLKELVLNYSREKRIKQRKQIREHMERSNKENLALWELVFSQQMKIKEPTIVSMFYDIRKIENNNPLNNRTIDKYLSLAKEFILKLPYPLIIYVNDGVEDEPYIYEFIMKERRENNLSHKTRIIIEPFKNTYFYAHIDKIAELQKKYTIINGDTKHETPHYIVLNNNKFHFLENAIELNPFLSTHFVWLDFGINHVAKNSDRINEWITEIPDKIKQLCINPYIEKREPKEFFQFIYHHTAGGLFSGSCNNMKRYIELFKKKTEEIYSKDWYQIDEAVMTMVQRENPELFDFFYGDYEGIISNYLRPRHSIDLIMTGLRKTYKGGRYDITAQMLDYMFSGQIENVDYFYECIEKSLVCNYYTNERKLKEYIINQINSILSGGNIERIKSIVVANINYYENKELIVVVGAVL